MAFEINKLLHVMVEQGASDVYLTEDAPAMFKVQGTLKMIDPRKLAASETESIAFTLMNAKQKRDFEYTHEMNLPYSVPGIGRFRINIFQQRGAIGIVIREIKAVTQTFQDLNLPSTIIDLVMSKRGLVLVVGATGSGKSTTLAAMVDYRNAHSSGHIITVEDPIEFIHEHKKSIITQREVGIDTDSFSAALKNSLRQAPDVILIGEIRDIETMDAAITFAETGHLVLATLHSNNANQAMERIMNFFPEERHRQIYLQLSMNLRGIVSQRLIPSKAGRLPAVEILLDSPRIKDLIYRAKINEIKDAIEGSASSGMQSFDQALIDLYRQGKITLDDALQNADSQNNLRLKIKLAEDVAKDKEKGNRLASLASLASSVKQKDSDELVLSIDEDPKI